LRFRPLTPAPFAARRTQDWLARSAAAPGAGGRITVVIPSQSRYSAPNDRQLYDERLATLPGVLRLSSTLVMKSVVDTRPLPL
jgi:hypothetical protein